MNKQWKYIVLAVSVLVVWAEASDSLMAEERKDNQEKRAGTGVFYLEADAGHQYKGKPAFTALGLGLGLGGRIKGFGGGVQTVSCPEEGYGEMRVSAGFGEEFFGSLWLELARVQTEVTRSELKSKEQDLLLAFAWQPGGGGIGLGVDYFAALEEGRGNYSEVYFAVETKAGEAFLKAKLLAGLDYSEEREQKQNHREIAIGAALPLTYVSLSLVAGYMQAWGSEAEALAAAFNSQGKSRLAYGKVGLDFVF